MSNYYEVEFRKKNSPEDSYSICIIGTRKPTIEEAEVFCRTDMEKLGYDYVGEVLEIDADEAHRFFDMENVDSFPVFGKDDKQSYIPVASDSEC